ncbi:MAG: hypothetical protein PHW04_02385 [Candidatus Wallbacteria bacterium]|nr:hypothetical protein [Candidatus Wallbacteria bacterium]
MKKKSNVIPKSMQEVWDWKKEVYEDTKNMEFEEKKSYFTEGIETALKILNAKLKKNPDGSFLIV